MGAEDWLAGDYDPEFDEQENQVISITGVIKETEKAILFQDEDVSFWIAKSVIEYQDEDEVVVPSWVDITFVKDAILDDFEEF